MAHTVVFIMLQPIPLSVSLWLRAIFRILYYFLVRSSQLTLVVFSETNRVGNLTCPSTSTSRSYCRSLVQLIRTFTRNMFMVHKMPSIRGFRNQELKLCHCFLLELMKQENVFLQAINNHHVLFHRMSTILFDYYDILFQLLPARFYRIYDHNTALEDGVAFGVLDKLFTTNHQVSHHKCLLLDSQGVSTRVMSCLWCFDCATSSHRRQWPVRRLMPAFTAVSLLSSENVRSPQKYQQWHKVRSGFWSSLTFLHHVASSVEYLGGGASAKPAGPTSGVCFNRCALRTTLWSASRASFNGMRLLGRPYK